MIIMPSLVHCWETDQYYCRTRFSNCKKTSVDLLPADDKFNDWVNKGLDNAARKFNRKFRQPTDKTTGNFDGGEKARIKAIGHALYYIGLELVGWWSMKMPIDTPNDASSKWGKSLPIEYRLTQGKQSIYRGFGKEMGLYGKGYSLLGGDPATSSVIDTIKINDVLVGIDKIQHMFTVPWFAIKGFGKKWKTHYKKHKSIPSRGLQKEFFEKIKLHDFNKELGILGKRIVGIFSPADMAANWIGFKDFYYRLLYTEAGILKFDKSKGWYMAQNFDANMSSYINPAFDEVINPCYFAPALAKKIRTRIKKDICKIIEKAPDEYFYMDQKYMWPKEYMPKLSEEQKSEFSKGLKKVWALEVCFPGLHKEMEKVFYD